MVPWITHVPGISNFRDLSTGSFPAGLVYRSADLSQLPESSLPALSGLIDTIIDVRSAPEILRNGTVGPINEPLSESTLSKHGVTRIHAPIFEETDYSPKAIATRHALYQAGHEGFVDAYRGILEHCGPTLRVIFKALAARADTATSPVHNAPSDQSSPTASSTSSGSSGTSGQAEASMQERKRDGRGKGILIHCSAGKDRTGILCAILLSLAGVSSDQVADEYALTTEGLKSHKERIIKSLGDVPHVEMDKVNIMMSSEPGVMKRTLEVIDAEYGGVETLVRKHVPQQQVDQVKKLITGDASTTNGGKL